MGVVTQRLAAAALRAGATIRTGQAVDGILVEGGVACGITTAGGAERRARAVCVNADPFRLRQLAGGSAAFPPAFNARLDAMKRDGTTMKAGWGGWGGWAPQAEQAMCDRDGRLHAWQRPGSRSCCPKLQHLAGQRPCAARTRPPMPIWHPHPPLPCRSTWP